MSNKVFTENQTIMSPLRNNSDNEKPLKINSKSSNRVDINVLKSKLQENENNELKKNIFILFILITVLAALGIYLSL